MKMEEIYGDFWHISRRIFSFENKEGHWKNWPIKKKISNSKINCKKDIGKKIEKFLIFFREKKTTTMAGSLASRRQKNRSSTSLSASLSSFWRSLTDVGDAADAAHRRSLCLSAGVFALTPAPASAPRRSASVLNLSTPTPTPKPPPAPHEEPVRRRPASAGGVATPSKWRHSFAGGRRLDAIKEDAAPASASASRGVAFAPSLAFAPA